MYWTGMTLPCMHRILCWAWLSLILAPFDWKIGLHYNSCLSPSVGDGHVNGFVTRCANTETIYPG